MIRELNVIKLTILSESKIFGYMGTKMISAIEEQKTFRLSGKKILFQRSRNQCLFRLSGYSTPWNAHSKVLILRDPTATATTANGNCGQQTPTSPASLHKSSVLPISGNLDWGCWRHWWVWHDPECHPRAGRAAGQSHRVHPRRNTRAQAGKIAVTGTVSHACHTVFSTVLI